MSHRWCKLRLRCRCGVVNVVTAWHRCSGGWEIEFEFCGHGLNRVKSDPESMRPEQ